MQSKYTSPYPHLADSLLKKVVEMTGEELVDVVRYAIRTEATHTEALKKGVPFAVDQLLNHKATPIGLPPLVAHEFGLGEDLAKEIVEQAVQEIQRKGK